MNNITTRLRLNGIPLTAEQKLLLDAIEYSDEEFAWLAVKIREYLRNGHSIDVLSKNWRQMRALGNNSSSLHSFVIRYGEEAGPAKFAEKNKSSSTTKEDLIAKYGPEEAARRLSANGASLENYVARHGEEEGTRRWAEYCAKRRAAFQKGKAEKKYASRDLAWFQNKYGEETGYAIWDKKRKAQAYKVSLEYYIEQYGEKEGRRRCKEAKTRSLKGFIAKYGEEDGTRRYKQWATNTAKGHRAAYSRWAMACCDLIKEQIPDLTHYGPSEKVFFLTVNESAALDQKIIRPDLLYGDAIIELQGDYYHGNPTMFNSSSIPHPFIDATAKELWAKDAARMEFYRSRGYRTLEIWESDFNNNPEKEVEKCVKFLTTKS